MSDKYLNNNCTVIVSSCDEYKDVWDSHFIILKAQYQDIKMPITLLTEKEDYNCSYMQVSVFKAGRKMPWGRRIRKALKSIKTDYVILLLDDYYPLGRIDQDRWERCYLWMEDNKNISSFTFVPVLKDNIRDGKYKGFERRPINAEYRLTCQPAMWRRERLIELIEPYYTPWDFELVGTMRSVMYDDIFYSLIDGEEPLYKHDFAKYGLRKGKWGIATKDLFKTYNIEMNFSKRGFFDDGSQNNEKVNISIIKNIKNRMNKKIRSLRVRKVRKAYRKRITKFESEK